MPKSEGFIGIGTAFKGTGVGNIVLQIDNITGHGYADLLLPIIRPFNNSGTALGVGCTDVEDIHEIYKKLFRLCIFSSINRP